jgi:dipeptidyl aminopeptidase/acylaminoacyl peptidase
VTYRTAKRGHAAIHVRPGGSPVNAFRFIAASSALFFATTASAQERIAYESDGDILVLEVATGVVTNVTNHAAIDAHPAWSPDGTRITFVSNRSDVPDNADGNLEVFTMAADGTDLVQVTKSEYPFPGQAGYDHYHPAYSPDGTQLVYEWYGPTGSQELYISNADGTNEVLLTDPADFASKYNPDWSPDGGSIVYTWGFGYLSGLDIHVIAPDGTGETSLSDPTLTWIDERNPRWSPDGTQIVYETNLNGNDDIYVMNADGSNVTQVTFDPAIDVEPSWDPDGLQISFSSTRGGVYEIYVIDAPPLVEEPPVEEPVAAGARMFALEVEEPVTQLTFGGDASEPTWTEGEFVPAETFVLTVTRNGRGSGGVMSVEPGILCGTDCTETYTAGTLVELTARAKRKSVFSGWGGACSGVGQCIVTMDQAQSVTATFRKK